MKNTIFTGVIFLLMTLSNSSVADGVEARVSVLEIEMDIVQSAIDVLQVEVEGLGGDDNSGLESRVTELEVAREKTESMSILPSAKMVAYDSVDGSYEGEIKESYPGSGRYFILKDFNGEQVYYPVGISEVRQSGTTAEYFNRSSIYFLDAGCTQQLYITAETYDSLAVLSENYPVWFFATTYTMSDTSSTQTYSFYQADEDLPTNYTALYTIRVDARSNAAVCYQIYLPAGEAYPIDSPVYMGTNLIFDVKYVDELPDEDGDHY